MIDRKPRKMKVMATGGPTAEAWCYVERRVRNVHIDVRDRAGALICHLSLNVPRDRPRAGGREE